MKYSDSFEQIHTMSLGIDLSTRVKYKRVAIYLGRVFMAHGGSWRLSIGRRTPAFGKKDIVLGIISGLTDLEWERVSGYMKCLVQDTGTSWRADRQHAEWMKSRRGWIRDLDTVRAFG